MPVFRNLPTSMQYSSSLSTSLKAPRNGDIDVSTSLLGSTALKANSLLDEQQSHKKNIIIPAILPTPCADASLPIQRTKSKKKKKSNDPEHVSRPSNCFVLFRSWAIDNGLTNHLRHQADKSKHVSQLWKGVDKKTKQYFNDRAAEEKLKHRKMYPGYKYAPNKKDVVDIGQRGLGTSSTISAVKKSRAARKSNVHRRKRSTGRKAWAPYLSPSPTASLSASDDDQALEDVVEDVEVDETIGVDGRHFAIGDLKPRVDDCDEERYVDDGKPLYSLWTQKFENMPRLVKATDDKTDDKPPLQSIAKANAQNSIATLTPPSSPTQVSFIDRRDVLPTSPLSSLSDIFPSWPSFYLFDVGHDSNVSFESEVLPPDNSSGKDIVVIDAMMDDLVISP